MFNIVAIGELLIDFTPVKSEPGTCYLQNAGGAPGNVLAMAARLGSETAFIGKVGNDKFGNYLGRVLTESGVNTAGLVYSEQYPTTLAFVHLEQNGDRSFSFYRQGCADVMLEEEDINYDLIDNTQALHFGSLSFTTEPSKTAVEKAVKYASSHGKLITYDPNYRPALWASLEQATEAMSFGLEYADIVKVSEAEAIILTGESDFIKAGQKLARLGIRLVCITLGEKGAFYFHNNSSGIVQGYPAKAVDTTGAGDAFMGAVIHQILDKKYDISDIKADQIREVFAYANAAASICVQRLGGIPAMPSRQDVEQKLRARQ